MRIPDPEHLNPAEARKAIDRAKSDKAVVAALLDRDHPDHKPAVDKWYRLHQAAYPEPGRVAGERLPARADGALGRAGGSAAGRAGRAPTFASAIDPRKAARPIKRRLRDERGADRNGPPNDKGAAEPPVINMAADRVQAILDGTPARFEIAKNPDSNPNFGAWRSLHHLGWNAVRQHEAIIEREAKAQGVDADLVKAIMYVENAQSLDSQFAEATGTGESESLLPMNIRPDPWAAIEDPPADLTDPATNIRIAVTLIRRISERIDDPAPAKVASIWNFAGRELVSDFGARVRDVYERRLWALPVVPTPELEESP